MKRIIFFLALASMGLTTVRAQCPMPCWKESFPYYFCDATGARHLKCSSDPTHEPGLTPVLTHIPGCVNVVPIDPSLDFQPSGPVPDAPVPPSREGVFGWQWSPQNYDPLAGWQDEYEWEIAHAQYISDSSNFVNGLPLLEPDTTDDITYPTDYDKATAMAWYNADLETIWLYYEKDYEETYLPDSTAHANGTDVPYTQVWNNAQANSDAQDGLNAWLGICNLQGDPNCCIYIEPDNNKQNWQGNYDPTAGKVSFHLGVTHGTGTYCSDGSSCPDHTSRFISYNATNSFLYANNDDQDLHSPSYILHPSPFNGWYTGPTVPPGNVVDPYQYYSFRQMVEHEIGHFLGMQHPEQKADDGTTCPNNQTLCGGSSGTSEPMLMSTTGIAPNDAPHVLQPDDKCMFEKLYCPQNLGVAQPQEPYGLNPEVFPNPTTGACKLQYEVSDRAFVRVAIYDVLGNQIRIVSSGYEEPGKRTISLGTESLSSGQYVCRVQVGEYVTYFNIAVER
jgi:hypothetical protein